MYDTATTLEIRSSPARLFGFAAAAVLMTGTSAILAFRLFDSVPAEGFSRIAGWVGLVFFGACAGLILWRAVQSREPVLTLSPEGIRDLRLSPQRIPWSAIRDVATWDISDPAARKVMSRFPFASAPRASAAVAASKVLLLKVDPQFEERLELAPIARWTRKVNKGLGADGLAVATGGLAIDHETLIGAVAAYRRAAGPGGGALTDLFREYEETPVSDSLETVLARLRTMNLLLPLAAPPGSDAPLVLLLGKDNRGRSWCYLYADEPTLAADVGPGTIFATMKFAEILELVRRNDVSGGIRVAAGEQFYLIPGEMFDRVEAALD